MESSLHSEMPASNGESRRDNPVLIVALACIAGALGAVISVAAFLLPALWAYAMCRTKPRNLVVFVAAFAACGIAMGMSVPFLSYGVLVTGMTVVLYCMQTGKAGNAYTALALLGVGVVSLYAAVCLPGILSGAGAFADVQSAMDGTIAFLRETLAATPGVTKELLDAAEEYFTHMSRSVSAMVVPLLCLASGALSISNLLLFHLFASKRKLDITPLRPFRNWCIPRSMTFGLLFLLLASLVAEWMELSFAEGLTGTVDMLIMMPLCLQGLCVIDFLIVRRDKNVTVKRVLIYTLVGLLPMFAQTPLLIISCADQLFRLRERAALPPASPMPR